jgi:hypothetical protein
MRADILRKTPLLGNYPAHDRPLLTELSLYGRFHEIPEFLFLDREHAQRSVRLYNWRKPHEAVAWYDPGQTGKIVFPSWRLFKEHIAGIHRAPINRRECVRCYIEMIKWIKQNIQDMIRDVIYAGSQIKGLGPIIKIINTKCRDSRWLKQTVIAAKDIESLIPAKDVFILVDEASFNVDIFARWKIIPFIEHNGQYWGPPQDDVTAISELERLRTAGANFIVLGWPTFWWFDHYREFYRYLNSRFQRVLQNERLTLFDLRS